MLVHPVVCGYGIAFLIETPQALFLVDSGSPGQQQRVISKMNELGRKDLKLIWITHAHYDHYGSAAALRNLTGARIGIHLIDADYMVLARSPLGTTRRYGFIYPHLQRILNQTNPLSTTLPDVLLSDGETLEKYGLNASILHTPGHTPGHSCLVLEDGTAFAGDLLGAFPRPGLQSLLATDWGQLAGSLEYLKSTAPKWIYTGHSRQPIPGSALQKIKNGAMPMNK
ncbi:MAG: MBL fold metallo-hydrolase [Anaerolineae bacterium]|jgi:glyoxylase-like metal-dependent hydrolase (beta-lactamase superfamily II)|nr:MBL fold metallo-hydrolase [Anaerolineae bacterium]